ncbi:16S rRNA (uracil(1498)-N(3))-methyltransferase [Noviherbaspirillum aridicola]|uniref:Ribosomal RNA small subunit methyltransferase E n=1 Tax=Noviherbaspirillum aridicola TaxID=2849687 RepID=A0ABQ4Q0T5_9BURK|nr:16S rRNA (uracil(1498)-N(3))-methyltransferase [Noviherbaspirillum aridicola]GIZ50651.1 ribosomal RNA small subunit methyltransferase E [Noviherbaspirillum aridicola]
MPRFYCPLPLAVGATVTLPDAIAHHVHVLRLAAGDTLTLFNGEGGEYAAVLSVIGKRQAQAEVKAFSPREAELPYALTLAQALPEGSKMDWIVEKAVELGAAAIQPLAARRCVVRLSPERAEKKLEHWQAIAAAAAEQCGRNRLTQLGAPMEFNAWMAQSCLHPRILFSPRAGQELSAWARHHPPQALTLMIGPEGGFSPEEEDAAIAAGALVLGLGARVLRTETAGLAALAALNACWGEI